MRHFIPELNLVVLGSMNGRVALLTLTQPPPHEQPIDPDTKTSTKPRRPRRAFRVDAVLPLASDEAVKPRPNCCLHGMAVSPIPETGAGLRLRRRRSAVYGGRHHQRLTRSGDTEEEMPRRWRLLLYYQDHTILQYEIVQREDGEDQEGDGLSGKARIRRVHSEGVPTGSHDDDKYDDAWAQFKGPAVAVVDKERQRLDT